SVPCDLPRVAEVDWTGRRAVRARQKADLVGLWRRVEITQQDRRPVAVVGIGDGRGDGLCLTQADGPMIQSPVEVCATHPDGTMWTSTRCVEQNPLLTVACIREPQHLCVGEWPATRESIALHPVWVLRPWLWSGVEPMWPAFIEQLGQLIEAIALQNLLKPEDVGIQPLEPATNRRSTSWP